MSDKRCETCKYWHKRDQPPYSPSEGREGDCGLSVSEDGKAKCAASKAVAYDAESYYAVLETTADFGCVMWEAREAADD